MKQISQNWIVPADVHPDDLRAAIEKRLQRAKTPVSGAEAMVLDGLATAARNGAEPVIDAKGIDPKAWQRIAKALRPGSQRRTFSPVEEFVLCNWRKVALGSLELPGLRHWNASAALDLLEMHGSHQFNDYAAYNRALFDLGLKREEILVTKFRFDRKTMTVDWS